MAKSGSLKSIAQRGKDEFRIDPRMLQVKEGWNPREDTQELRDHIRCLADSIKEVGVKEALTVFMEDGVAYVTDGHCRLAGTMLAISEGAVIDTIPIKSDDRNAGEDHRILMTLVRNQQMQLTFGEKAKQIKKLVDLGWEKERIEKSTGYSRSQVLNFLAFSQATPKVVKMVKEKKVSPTNAAAVIRKSGADTAEEILEGASENAEKEGRTLLTKEDISKVKTEGSTTEEGLKENTGSYEDGFYAGLLHALALICEEEITDRAARKARETLFGDAKLNSRLACAGDIQILRCHFHDI